MIPSNASATPHELPSRAPSALRDRVLSTVAKVPSRTRREGRVRATLFYALAIVPSLVLFEAWGGFGHSAGRPRALTLVVAMGAAIGACACAAIAWWRSGSMLGRPTSLLAVPPLVFPGLTLAWLTLFHARYVEPFARVGYRCLALSLLAGGALLGAALWLRRGTVLRTEALAGAALGTTAASFAAIEVDLWCPLTNVAHSLIGHVLPIVLLTALGALLGRAFLGQRGSSGKPAP